MRFARNTLHFGSKAETLQRLRPLLSRCTIPESYHFSVADWASEPAAILSRIETTFGDSLLAVRSSALNEDGDLSAMAGVYHSVLDVPAANRALLEGSIQDVIGSYQNGRNADGGDQILVQRMLSDVSMSGVVFTQDMNTGAPYYVINYDDQSGRTDTVTSGMANRTLYVFRGAVPELASTRFRALLLAVQEVEAQTQNDSLDIEFVVGKDNTVYLLQARRITTRPNWNRSVALRVQDAIVRMREFVRGNFRPQAGIHGKSTLYGQMPDWNPAEMIGTVPRPLAFSMYRRLITDAAWRKARASMGYAEPRGLPLMVSLSGQPFIDVRASLLSFLPQGLPGQIGAKLVDAWLDKLRANHELHDKIEFDVAITALQFDHDQRLEELYPGLLSKTEAQEFRDCLTRLTRNLVEGKVASLEFNTAQIEHLKNRRTSLLQGADAPEMSLVSGLLEDCIEFVTIPFAVLARHAFIATSLLRSLVARGAMDADSVSRLQRSIQTVAGEFVSDLERFGEGQVTLDSFLERYGHLRPGSYDIMSLRYDQRSDLIRGLGGKSGHRHVVERFEMTTEEERSIKLLLQEAGFELSPAQLVTYISGAIAAREFGKFEFTKNVSDALEIVAQWGERRGLSREELSYLSIEELLDVSVVSRDRNLEQGLRDRSRIGAELHETTLAVRLPYLVEKEEDVAIVPLLITRPNFITRKVVRAPVTLLTGHAERPPELSGKIVLIESADPGFDWIFSADIAGLITKFGGANSHMAIRCAEFDVPAAIGCGEQLFDRILQTQAAELNCTEGRLVPTT